MKPHMFATVQRNKAKVSRNSYVTSSVRESKAKIDTNRQVSGDAVSISNLDSSEYTQATAYHRRMS